MCKVRCIICTASSKFPCSALLQFHYFMAPCKLLAALEEAGLDDELNLIQYELDMDADANDDENEEHEEAEQLGSRDSEDDIGKANTSSTVQNTPTLSHPATRKWKFSTKSNEQDDDGACMHSHFQDC